MNRLSACLLICAVTLPFGANVQAHCQIPCGIYTDGMRFDMIEEHIKTIEKSMKLIRELSAADPVDYNQLVRWVGNKEEHAQEIQDVVNHYFLTQRVKPAAEGDEKYDFYVTSLRLLHGMLVSAMKTRQTTDQAHIDNLRMLVAEYKALYFEEHGHTH